MDENIADLLAMVSIMVLYILGFMIAIRIGWLG